MKLEECKITEFIHTSGYRMVRLENGVIAVILIPEKGAEIHSFKYLPLGIDVLWKAPWGLRKCLGGAAAAGSGSEAAWMDQYAGGWQGIFPNGGEPCHYRGAHHNFHGEASVVPWNFSVLKAGGDSACISCDVVLARSPFALQRVVRLERDSPVLHIEESIVNQGTEEMPFMWGHHPALGAPFLSADCHLQIPARSFQRHDQDAIVAWDTTGFAHIPGPDARKAEFGYLSGFKAGWYAISNAKLGLTFALAWPKDVFPYAWFWQEFHGTLDYPWYGRSYVMAVEPFTTVPALGLAHAVTKNTAAMLAPECSIQVELAATLFQDAREIKNFSPSGQLVFV